LVFDKLKAIGLIESKQIKGGAAAKTPHDYLIRFDITRTPDNTFLSGSEFSELRYLTRLTGRERRMRLNSCTTRMRMRTRLVRVPRVEFIDEI